MDACNAYIVKAAKDDSPIPTIPLGQYFITKLREHGNKVAQIYPQNGTYTFLDVLSTSITFAKKLKSRGIERGDVVILLSGLSPECMSAVFGTIIRGATLAPLNPLFDKGDLQRMCEILQPKLIAVQKELLGNAEHFLEGLKDKPAIMELKDIQPASLHECENFEVEEDPHYLDRIAIVLSSSGTTGLPKGISITCASVYRQITDFWNSRKFIVETDVMVQTAGVFWVTGMFQPLFAADFGVKLVIFPRLDIEKILRAIPTYKVTYLMIPPQIAVQLAKSPIVRDVDLSSLRTVLVAGAAFAPDSELIVRDALRTRVVQGYGLTECLFLTICDNPRKTGSVGQLLENVEAKIRNPDSGEILKPTERGELAIRNAVMFKGYFNNPEATAAAFDKDGWFLTGDEAYFDEEGYLFIVDRVKDLIKYRGMQVAPVEIESLLLSHPDVKDAAVVGKKSVMDQEHATAFVVRQQDAKVTEEELIKLVESQLASYKWLYGGVRFVEALPRTASAKIKRRQLKELL